MRAAKHTPGPWFVDGVRFVRQEPAPRHVICRLPTTRNEGDARLIAAAPDLLEALQNLENDDNSIPAHAWELVQSAIHKATGEHA